MDKNSEVGLIKEKVKKWLNTKATNDEVIDKLVELKLLKNAMKELEIGLSSDITSNGYKEYIKLIKRLLQVDETEVEKIESLLEIKKDEVAKLKKSVGLSRVKLEKKDSVIADLEQRIGLKCAEIKELDVVISDYEDILANKENDIKNLKIDSMVLEDNIKKLKSNCKKLKLKNEEYARKEARLNKGKKHIRGTDEFYRDVKIACSMVQTKLNKRGKEYNSYSQVLKHAKSCETIQNYCNANKVKLSRDNLKNWLSIAEALESGMEPTVSVGKYSKNKGYKR